MSERTYPQWIRDMAYGAFEAKETFQEILASVIWDTYRQSMVDVIGDVWANRNHPNWHPSPENEEWADRTVGHLMGIAEDHCGFRDDELIALVDAQAEIPGFAAWRAERDRRIEVGDEEE